MAVIKIVPMPGAVGDKGDPGETGPQGPQGQTGQTGQNGQDALWNYNGAYNPGAGYAVGDVVTYNGQTWYRKHANGGNVGDTPSEGIFWDLVAAKGVDGSQLNYWDGVDAPQDPAEDGFLIVDGIVTGPGSNILVSADDRVFIGGNNGEFLNGLSTPENQIATIGDLTTPTSGTWDLKFSERSGITYSDSASLHEFGNYYCIGDLVFFDAFIKLNNVSDWGNSLGFSFDLPFLEHQDYDGIFVGPSFSGTIWDHSVEEDIANRTGRDQGIYHIVGKYWDAAGQGYVHLYVTAYDSSLGNSLVGELRSVTKSYPSPLDQALYQEYSNIRMSGVYRKA